MAASIFHIQSVFGTDCMECDSAPAESCRTFNVDQRQLKLKQGKQQRPLKTDEKVIDVYFFHEKTMKKTRFHFIA